MQSERVSKHLSKIEGMKKVRKNTSCYSATFRHCILGEWATSYTKMKAWKEYMEWSCYSATLWPLHSWRVSNQQTKDEWMCICKVNESCISATLWPSVFWESEHTTIQGWCNVYSTWNESCITQFIVHCILGEWATSKPKWWKCICKVEWELYNVIYCHCILGEWATRYPKFKNVYSTYNESCITQFIVHCSLKEWATRYPRLKECV